MEPAPVAPIFCKRGDGAWGGRESANEGGDLESDSVAAIRKCNINCTAKWEWDRTDRSKDAFPSRGDSTTTVSVTFHPNFSNGTAGIRASRPLLGAYNYWEIHVSDRLFGTSLMFGVSTKAARLHANEFKNLLGEDAHGWGLSHTGRVYHNGESAHYCKPFQFCTPVTVGVLVDRKRGEISFFKDGFCLGVAFTGLNIIEDDLYPTICSTAAKTTMVVGQRLRSFLDLQDRCREVIVAAIMRSPYSNKHESSAVETLPLPSKVKRFILGGLKGLKTIYDTGSLRVL